MNSPFSKPNAARATQTGTRAPFSKSPVLGIKLAPWRSSLVVFVLFTGFGVMVARAGWLQLANKDFLQNEGAKRFVRTLDLPATRGRVLDRNGHVLASSVPVKAVWAVPDDVEINSQQRRQLANLLDVNERDLQKKLEGEQDFVYLKRQIENELADKIAALKIEGVGFRREYKRYYPEGEVAAHVVGFTNIEDKGQEGVELAQQATLLGTAGSRRVIKDKLGRVVEEVNAIAQPKDGQDVVLALDSSIQYLAFSQLKQAVETHKAKAGAVVVLSAQSGEVLAMANWPSYNPNSRIGLSGAQLRNRVLTDAFEPGSTMKPFTMALALESGRNTPNTKFQTAPGKMVIEGATIGDTHPEGELTLAQVLQKSSNVGTVKIALQFTPQEMWAFLNKFGFGQAPKVAFQGATSGRIRAAKNWRKIEQATISYGHGMSASVMQLARAYTAFARDGDIVPVSFIKSIGVVQGTRLISSQTAASLRTMLEAAAGPGGTATKAQVAGFRVAGKTGTAYKVEDGRYNTEKYIASFVGFAPVSAPRVVVAVMIDEPSGVLHFGGDVAAPVFSNIVAGTMRQLNVSPDLAMNSKEGAKP